MPNKNDNTDFTEAVSRLYEIIVLLESNSITYEELPVIIEESRSLLDKCNSILSQSIEELRRYFPG